MRLLLTANGLQSRPSRRADAASGPPPTQQPVWAGLSNCLTPRRSRFRSIANSRSSKRILTPVPPSAFRCGLEAEVSSPIPHELDPSSSLPAWSLSSSPWLAVPRSWPLPMTPTSIGKSFSSYYLSTTDSLSAKQAVLTKIKAVCL
jgi:hypothetical protein